MDEGPDASRRDRGTTTPCQWARGLWKQRRPVRARPQDPRPPRRSRWSSHLKRLRHHPTWKTAPNPLPGFPGSVQGSDVNDGLDGLLKKPLSPLLTPKTLRGRNRAPVKTPTTKPVPESRGLSPNLPSHPPAPLADNSPPSLPAQAWSENKLLTGTGSRVQHATLLPGTAPATREPFDKSPTTPGTPLTRSICTPKAGSWPTA